MATPTSSYRQFRASAKSAEIRFATFEGRQHIVVPVVAMIGDTVVWSVTAPKPEFVPASVIARSAIEWNGRPCVGSHPQNDKGEYISANDPKVYEQTCFGRVCNARFENGALQMDAWLDESKASGVGEEAEDVIRRAKNKETIEVSIGAYVLIEDQEGTAPNGDKYYGVWSDVGSDHLAHLPADQVGACSVEKGCGAPRVAKNKEIQKGKEGIPQMRVASDTGSDSMNGSSLPKRLMNGILTSLGFRPSQEEGEVSDVELRQKLAVKLRSVEPGFDWIVEVFPDSSEVIYTSFPEDKMLWWKRSFTVSDSGEVTLSDDKVMVEPTTVYKEISANSTGEGYIEDKPCKCQKNDNDDNEQGKGKEIQPMSEKEKKDLVSRLISSKKNGFTEADRKGLEAMSETGLKAMEGNGKEEDEAEGGNGADKTPSPSPDTPPTPKTPETPSAVSASSLAQIDVMELATLRDLASKEKVRQAARRDQLISALKGGKTAWSDSELVALSLEMLEKVYSTANSNTSLPIDYSAAHGVSANTSPEDDLSNFMPPDSYGLIAAASKKKNSRTTPPNNSTTTEKEN